MELFRFFYNLRENKPFLCVIFFVSYAMGLLAFYWSNPLIPAVFYTVPVLLIFILLLFFKKLEKLINPWFLLALYILFICGFLNARIHNVGADEFSEIFYLKDVEITGEVYSIPKFISKSNSHKFQLKVKTAGIAGERHDIKNAKVLVTLKGGKKSPPKINYADTVSIKGALAAPMTATNPGQFDYRKFLQNKGILKTFYAKDEDFKFVAPPDIKHFNLYFTRLMYDMRDKVILEHSKYIKPPALEVLGGVVFGDEAVNSPDEVKDSFINSGLLHLLAASGLNVAFILSMWLCVIYFLNLPYRLKISSGIFVVFLYTVMTGFPPSIVRASVMLILVLAGKLIYREANGVSLIFAAGFLILMFKPQFICDTGFQLSFLVTLGLIICIPPVSGLFKEQDKNYIRKIRAYPKAVKSFLLVFSPVSLSCMVMIPLVAQLWAGPLQAFYFNTFSLYSIPANIAVVPFIGVVSFLGFMSTAVCFIPYLSKIVLPVLDYILNIIIRIVLNISDFFAALPNSLIRVPSPPPFEILTFYIFIAFLFGAIKYLFKNRVLNIFTAVTFLFLAVQLVDFNNPDIEVTFFSVGNADNCLIKTPKGKYILIDTGRYIYKGTSSAKTVTLEYFYDKNIRELDTLIVTHFDSDHSGGLLDILENVKVKNLIMPKTECSSQNSCAIEKYVRENNIDYIIPYTGQNFSFDGGIELVNYVPKPVKPTPKKKKKNGAPPKKSGRGVSRNDSSTVTFLKAGDYKFLFMADAPVEAFNSIEKFIAPDIDVLKVAHHGAKNTVDDEMLSKLRPEFSVISTGKNPYGHPNPKTVSKLLKYSIPLSTNQFGAIQFKFNGFNPTNYLTSKRQLNAYRFDNIKKRFIPIEVIEGGE